MHLPVAGTQVFLAQALSLTLWQRILVAGLSWHAGGLADLLQKSVPLQKSPSWYLTQSASLAHTQVATPAWQTPSLHESLWVHGLPSSQPVPVAVGSSAHTPVAGVHWLFWQAVSANVGQVMTVAGLTWHFRAALLQNSVPLQRSPSSYANTDTPVRFWARAKIAWNAAAMPPWAVGSKKKVPSIVRMQTS